jgi:YD repeat-containing protein
MKWLFGMLMALSVITSCKKDKDEEETKPGCQLTKITQGLNPDTDTVFMFKYREDGFPESISREGDLGDIWFDVVYVPGTLSVQKVWKDLEGNEDWVVSEYEYNAQNKLSKARSYMGQEFTYQYDAGGQLTRVDVTRWGNLEGHYFKTVMDNNGSLIEVQRISTETNKLWDAFTVEYTDIENSIGKVNTLNLGNDRGMSYLFPGSEFFPFPSKYLVKKRINKNSSNEPSLTVNYAYEKDAKSNVTKAVVSFIYSPTGETRVLTWKFDYECK